MTVLSPPSIPSLGLRLHIRKPECEGQRPLRTLPRPRKGLGWIENGETSAHRDAGPHGQLPMEAASGRMKALLKSVWSLSKVLSWSVVCVGGRHLLGLGAEPAPEVRLRLQEVLPSPILEVATPKGFHSPSLVIVTSSNLY